MKKTLAALWVMCLLVCFCMPVSAAPGGVYRIEEAGMSVTIPQGWMVFTRNATSSDPDVQRYGGYDVLMQDMKAGNFYLEAVGLDNEALMIILTPENEILKEGGSLTEIYGRSTPESWANQVENLKKGVVSGGIEFLGTHQSDESGKKNNYLYMYVRDTRQGREIYGYATAIAAKMVVISMYRLDDANLTEGNKATLRSILSTVH